MTDRVKISELCTVVQGEGSLMGVPHVLIRTIGCPLKCEFGSSKCDTPYSKSGEGKFSLDDVGILLSSVRGTVYHVMITGGEPTIHDELLIELIKMCKRFSMHITIETAGFKHREVFSLVGLVSLSPKMSNSIPSGTERDMYIHNMARSKTEEMKKMITTARDYQLKYVVANQKDIDEAIEHSQSITEDLHVPMSKIWLMPEGDTPELLAKSRKLIIESCIKIGTNYSDRLHIVAYGEGVINV